MKCIQSNPKFEAVIKECIRETCKGCKEELEEFNKLFIECLRGNPKVEAVMITCLQEMFKEHIEEIKGYLCELD